MANDATKKLNPTALNPYFLRNVIKNPKPTNIITWISWNTEMRKKTKIQLEHSIFISDKNNYSKSQRKTV